MSIRLSGSTPINHTFISAGTRAEFVTVFQTKLVAAGWFVISGGGTNHVIIETAVTPQGLKTRIDILDPGTGNCVQFKLKDNGTLVGPATFYLLPVGGLSFRLWVNKYQFFFFLSGTDMTKQRALVCGGVPWVPSFIQDYLSFTYAGWLHGNGVTDIDTRGLQNSMRAGFIAGNILYYSAIWNGAVFGSTVAPVGKFGLLCQSAGTIFDDLWEEGTFTLFEPVLVWESSSFGVNPVRHGQMWDAVTLSKPLTSELRRTFGDMKWLNICHSNGLAGGIGRGSLMLLVPDS